MSPIACVLSHPNLTGRDPGGMGAFWVSDRDGRDLGHVERGWPSPGPLWYAHDPTGRRHGRLTIDDAVACLLAIDLGSRLVSHFDPTRRIAR